MLLVKKKDHRKFCRRYSSTSFWNRTRLNYPRRRKERVEEINPPLLSLLINKTSDPRHTANYWGTTDLRDATCKLFNLFKFVAFRFPIHHSVRTFVFANFEPRRVEDHRHRQTHRWFCSRAVFIAPSSSSATLGFSASKSRRWMKREKRPIVQTRAPRVESFRDATGSDVIGNKK